MTQPWFDPIAYAWIPGTCYGVTAGLMGALVGWLVPQGKARSFVIRAWSTLWFIALAMLVLGLFAWSNGQPYGVWFGIFLPGLVGSLVLGGNFLTILYAYRKVEERRLAAKDLL